MARKCVTQITAAKFHMGSQGKGMIMYGDRQESDGQPIPCAVTDLTLKAGARKGETQKDWPRASRRGGECQCRSVQPFAAAGSAAS